MGLSSFVSLGRRCDVSANDLLQFWSDDERTKAVLLGLESFGNRAKFARIATRLSARKPVFALASADPNQNDLARRAGIALAASPEELVALGSAAVASSSTTEER